jgi:hypothetical protein
MCYFIVLMSSLLSYYVENSKKKLKKQQPWMSIVSKLLTATVNTYNLRWNDMEYPLCWQASYITTILGSLKDRHIENGSELYAIFTPKENLKQAPHMPQRETTDISGEENVRWHIMLKVNSSHYWKIQSSTWQDSIYVYIYSCFSCI